MQRYGNPPCCWLRSVADLATTTENIPDTEAVAAYLQDLQDRICGALEDEDGVGRFTREHWQHGEGGGGITRVLSNGGAIERGGVNFSSIQGHQLPAAASARHPELAGKGFRAMGVSLVIHPHNPYAPTSHMNVRCLVAGPGSSSPVWWFGGGFDLTPCYGFREDAVHWHRVAAEACAEYGDDVYPRFKHWCDEYFYLRHRDETRGIGGLFFDDLNEWGFSRCFAFLRSVGDAYTSAYLPILKRRKEMSFGQRERDWQLYRRGRYVEFNLVYDRGTLFGLQSGGRTESILMSMPPMAAWRYDYTPPPGSAESQLAEEFLGARDWLG